MRETELLGERPSLSLAVAPSRRRPRREDILQDVQIRDEVILLKDKPDVLCPKSSALVLRHGIKIVVV